ncbi:DUF1684 domain-containing protein [Flavobacterium sp. Fl-77]|uniref:DUF1684 domain-containing protein n=1 Tax=Flavobacterium flavipigmentatum TaxID=2893884 RepID=A0AAJ2SDN2_9FLAO|nr:MULTISPECIES: DUF1684 domain-containing protein [unclassified Flavobacterium]MDX6182978.1 DUF1684 domain-containing protein [Flavobacterium sp. Fl-33]MDX6186431.1 DUF1684 domain-containing protein [Flavobacterium sp. Fl-77]UFH37783.1 DUF1684 domain-containing protein [Flavobacterium sp. F-70]
MKNLFSFVVILIWNFGFAQANFSKTEVEKFQSTINAEFADAKTSPLMEEDLKTFKTLEFFPINKNYFVDAKFVKANNEKVFEMKTTGKRTPKYIKYGTVFFTIDGVALRLNVYRNIELSKQEEYKDHLFLPFSDVTSGKESYIGGRYIDLKIPKGDIIAIDFNQAYNPYCAYNHKYSCPIVPLENDLKVAIRAGVKAFH